MLRPRLHIILVVGALLLAMVVRSASADDAAWNTAEEHWYVIELDGQRAGHALSRTETDGNLIRSSSHQHLKIQRGPGHVAVVSIKVSYVETTAGKPVRIDLERRLSQVPEVASWTFAEDGVTEVSVKSGERVSRQRESPVGTWLMPHAAETYLRARLRSGEDTFEYRSIDVSEGLGAVILRHRRSGTRSIEALGRTFEVSTWDIERINDVGSASTQVVDLSEDGEIVQMTDRSGPWTMVARLATRDEAMRTVDAAPELLLQTFVRPNKPIRASQHATSARYRIRVKEGKFAALPSAGAQSCEVQEDGSQLVVVDRHTVPDSIAESEDSDPALLEATSLIDGTDEAINRLRLDTLREVIGGDEARAEALRRAVYRHIERKGLSDAFASASETVRSRRGDCSEHSVLLCALLRSADIPARIATGLVYADRFAGERNIFAWHMWTQALIDDRWVDLDATTARAFSAAHILVSTSTLANGALSSELTAVVSLMGNIEIDVLEVGYE